MLTCTSFIFQTKSWKQGNWMGKNEREKKYNGLCSYNQSFIPPLSYMKQMALSLCSWFSSITNCSCRYLVHKCFNLYFQALAKSREGKSLLFSFIWKKQYYAADQICLLSSLNDVFMFSFRAIFLPSVRSCNKSYFIFSHIFNWLFLRSFKV